MKTKLLIVFFLITTLNYSQSIANFTSNPNTNFTLLSPALATQHASLGENASWTLSDLVQNGATVDTYTTPTTEETTTYPGTTDVLTITTQSDTPRANKIFLLDDNTNTSITGISQENITLNYTVNAFIGVFPMNYTESSNTTPISGTFTYTNGPTIIPGTFTGTITTNVDAYGTLNYGDYSKKVTRLSVNQTLSLSITSLPDVGTFTQNNYYYYNNTTNNIDLRYNYSNISSIALGINNESATLEFNTTDYLSTNDYVLASAIAIYPNPTNSFINITMPNNESIKTISVYDNQGREVLTNNENTRLINTNNLQGGVYFLSIETQSGKIANKKFVKS